MMTKRILILNLILIVAIFTSSCKEQVEIEDISVVIATGLDLEEDQVVVTVEVVVPLNRAEQSSAPNSMILQEKGDTIMEAVRNVTLNFDKKLFFSHNTVLIFSEELAQKGIANYLDFFIRDNEPRETAYIVVAKGAKAYEVMGINDGISGTSGEYLKALIENTKFTLKSRGLTINEFFKYYYRRETPLLGVVQIREITDIKPITGEIGSKTLMDVRGGAPFYKDSIVGYFNSDEMVGFNFLVDEVEEGIIIFETPDELLEYSHVFSQVGRYTTFEIVRSNTKLDIEIVDGKPKIKVKVNTKGFIVEDNKGLNTNFLQVRDGVQKAIEKQIKEHIAMALEKGQEFKTDSFGINHLFYGKYPDEFRKVKDNWGHEFSKMDYSIDVNVGILRTGLTNTPTNIKRGDEF